MYFISYSFKSWSINFKTFFVFIFLGISIFGFAQNKAEDTFSAKGISEVIIDGNQIFNITVTTEVSETIAVKSISDGEYGNDYQVTSEVNGKQLRVNLKRVAIEDTPDDKRNAHKVIAATLEIKLPDNINLSIKSDVGSVKANGKFNNLNISLSEGGCNIEGTARVATIKTIDGHIVIKTKNAIIQTDSHHGLVDFPSDMLGTNLWRLTTNGGNITVKKMNQ